jgi:hypothetical protein
VQAVEVEGVPFGLAVQWHPEENADDLRLFTGLVDAAREYRASTSPAVPEGPAELVEVPVEGTAP